jgi:hypothetical protein
MKYQNIDRIELGPDDYDSLFKWKENNRNLVSNFKPVLEEGVIVVDKWMKQYFKQGETAIELEVHFEDEKVLHLLMTRMDNGQLEILHRKLDPMLVLRFGQESEEILKDAITLHAITMAYMEYFMEQREYITKKMVTQGTPNKKKGGKKKAKKAKKIQHRVFYIKAKGNEEEVEHTREYERQAEAWTVRGHWRHLKDGRKVWVRPYIKGDPEQVEGNIYTL